MSSSVILACLWVLAATLTAFLPLRYQMIPGGLLLVTAPLILGFLAFQHGIWIFLLGLAGFLSIFRRPLGHLWWRLRRAPTEPPK